MKLFVSILPMLLVADYVMATCTNPQVTASSYTPSDRQVLNAIPFIAEFSLACDNGETPALFGDIGGKLVPVVQTLDGSKYQVSWTVDVKKVVTGDHPVALYDSEGYTQVKRARDRGEESVIPPLVTVVVNYPGSYGGPWLNSEHLAAGLAALVFYLAFSSRSSPLA